MRTFEIGTRVMWGYETGTITKIRNDFRGVPLLDVLLDEDEILIVARECELVELLFLDLITA